MSKAHATFVRGAHGPSSHASRAAQRAQSEIFRHTYGIFSPPMRISTKLTLGSSLVGLLVFGGFGAIQIAREKRDLEEDALRDTTILCHAVAESIRQDIAQADPADSEELTRTLERLDGRLDVVLWRGSRGAPLGRQELHSPAGLVESVARRAETTSGAVAEIVEIDAGGRVAAVGVAIEPQGPDAAVVVRPLDDVDADIAEETQLMAIAVVGFSLLSGVMGLLLGLVYVERPLGRLARAMTRVGHGDLDASVGPAADDEIGRVMRRFDEMARELHAADNRLRDEQAAHRAALARLRDADRLVTVGQLSAGLAHEIGSPLQILQSRARKLEQHADEPAEVAHTATIIGAQLERITRVVQQLLTFARPRDPERRPADPGAAVRAVVDLLELEAKRKSIDIVVDSDTTGFIEVDADALQQIVLNLARNALSAAHRGGSIRIELRHETTGGAELAASRASESTLRLLVVDNGRGIDKDVKRRMFEPFFTTRGSDGGMGLGLAVVRSLVDSLRGTVRVDSPAEGGTRFEVVLPC
jgi:signal transduction histidine kinase